MMSIGIESLQNVRRPSFWFGSNYYNFRKSASSSVRLQRDEEDDIDFKNYNYNNRLFLSLFGNRDKILRLVYQNVTHFTLTLSFPFFYPYWSSMSSIKSKESV